MTNLVRIEEMMKPKVTKPHYIYSGDLAEQQYATCIRKLVKIITESYRVPSSFVFYANYFNISLFHQWHIVPYQDFYDERKQKKLSVSKEQEDDSEKADETKYCFAPEEVRLIPTARYIKGIIVSHVCVLVTTVFRTS